MGAVTVRRGLVLGGGGVLGSAWTVGALSALERQIGLDAREFDMFVGVSAGAVTSALLACGVDVATMLRHQRGTPLPGDIATDYDDSTLAGPDGRPPKPQWGIGSPALIAAAARRPGQVPPLAVLSGAMPIGRASLNPVRKLVAGVCPDNWARHPSAWIVAMDYATGHRTVFGRPGDPVASLPDAVAASCAIPGWFAPVEIGGRRYVDGGMYSNTSVDLLAGQGLDEVFVLAPMVSFQLDEPEGVRAKLERRWRRAVTRRVEREAEKVRVSGAAVTILGPGPEDLVAMGANLMDPTRKLDVVETAIRTATSALRHAGVRE